MHGIINGVINRSMRRTCCTYRRCKLTSSPVGPGLRTGTSVLSPSGTKAPHNKGKLTTPPVIIVGFGDGGVLSAGFQVEYTAKGSGYAREEGPPHESTATLIGEKMERSRRTRRPRNLANSRLFVLRANHRQDAAACELEVDVRVQQQRRSPNSQGGGQGNAPSPR